LPIIKKEDFNLVIIILYVNKLQLYRLLKNIKYINTIFVQQFSSCRFLIKLALQEFPALRTSGILIVGFYLLQ